ncbi:flagellar filament capping protein FliD [Alicyclobacillus cycloheptanicus]|uniref:Flagellar hook-associated protein 2 n=1 Tax=Alicyclobacillus cycloheptanicus TaxID=1457 RepID=A0ABT9XKB6_9BACL|nr:flagellar filament capping protein FliD [Alicyclobacillus cycloheptanicus]MDQ0190667.1 flagellar hook-associated protein 2 [Alicyclobacillus cycloheptanicus]WDM00315.1 flagellar filament capping protein FliD [Alicyclobacillus cycloheptanicus]
MSVSLQQLQQQLNSIPNVTGNGVPVQTYASEEQQILTQELTSEPDAELTTISNQTSALNSLQTALQQLQTATQSLASAQTWTPVNAVSSNTSAFTVSAGAGALVSSFGVTITNLAQNQVTVAAASVTTASASGTFSINYNAGTSGTASVTIDVTEGERLSDIIAAINEQTPTTGVEAFVMGNNQLAFASKSTGADAAFTVSDVTGDFISSLNLQTTESAQDATIVVGGTTITSSTNTFSNVIPGVTLTALSSGTGTLSVTQNTSDVVSSVQNWMTAYNNVIDLLNKDTAYTPATASSAASSGPLSGDATATGLLAQLPNALNSLVSSSKLQSLSAIGIVVDPNTGHLEFQSSSGFTINGKTFGGSLQDGQTMFQNALEQNPSDVEALFGVVPNTTLATVIPQSGVLGNLNNTLDQYLGFGSIQGMIPNELTSLQTQTNNINQYLNQVNQEIANRIANFTAQLNALNASLQHAQAQMSLLSSLFSGVTGSSTSSSSSSSSGSSSSSSSSNS